jgi:hypothetical protein
VSPTPSILGLGLALLWLVLDIGIVQSPSKPQPRRMSFHNRLLLNRAAVSGLRTLEVMFAVRGNALAEISTLIEHAGGRVRYIDTTVRYVRAEVPTDRLLELVEDNIIEAYQISSLSRGSWYRDGPPQSNAEMYRGFERVIPNARPEVDPSPGLSPLSPELARQSGYTADEDAGVKAWLQQHPSFDGRGVTIALLESGQPEFTHPTLGAAKSLDGRDVPKLAGILNTIDPEQPDETRVELNVEFTTPTAWHRIGDRTYAVPGPGRYRFGLFTLPVATNLIHRFGVLEDEATRDIRVDTNGDADFRGEKPVADVNERFDVRFLKITYPRPLDLSFVVARGRKPHSVHIYIARGGHQAMTLSVAAGSRTQDGLAYGVAPGARVLLARTMTPDFRLCDFVEGYLEVIKRPDIDVLSDSTGIMMVPDTAADFIGLLFNRMVAAYDKPIFRGAGNMYLWLGSASSFGGVFSVGGSIGPQTFAALYGGAPLAGLMVHPVGAAGPAIDGALKPDFLAPVHRIAADLWGESRPLPLPKNAQAMYLPMGYQISCCTSASAPYAAGVGALLLSAVKQEHVSYSLESLGRALRVGARFLEGWPAHEQGNGVLDVNAAFRELTHAVETPRIRTTANVTHPLAPYAAKGTAGEGIFERDGWSAGMTGRRAIQFRRESGPSRSVAYRLSWSGNDGTFATRSSIPLPLQQTVSLPVTIAVHSAGAHSAILNLHDPGTDAIVFRTQATVVASERFDTPDFTLRLTGSLPLLRHNARYLSVPEDIGAMSTELEVTRGSVSATVLPNHGLFPNYYGHLYPGFGRTFTKGRYHVLIPHPAAGTWTLVLENISGWVEPNQSLVSTDDAECALTARLFHASLRPRASGRDTLDIDLENLGAELRSCQLDCPINSRSTSRRALPHSPCNCGRLHPWQIRSSCTCTTARRESASLTTSQCLRRSSRSWWSVTPRRGAG